MMDRLINKVRQDFPWPVIFVDTIAICSECIEQVEVTLERWRSVLERKRMKVSRSNTVYVCECMGGRQNGSVKRNHC